MSHHQGTRRSAGLVAGPDRHGPAGVKDGFRFDLSSGSWWWSPGMYTLHGYRPGEGPGLPAGPRLVFAHRHPDDRAVVRTAWRQLIVRGGLVAVHYRVLGADGVIRRVFVMVSPVSGSHRQLAGVTGVMELD